MRSIVVASAVALIVAGISSTASANVVGSKVVQGKTRYIDVVASGPTAGVWARLSPTACSVGDVKIMDLSVRKTTWTDAAKTICTVKGVYDSGKTIAGCGSTIVTGVCIAASVPSGGAAAVVCSASVVYTANKGLLDCVDGLRGAIAHQLGIETQWAAVQTGASLASGQWLEAIDHAIDVGCAGVK